VSKSEDRLFSFFNVVSEEFNSLEQNQELSFASKRMVQRMRKRARVNNPALVDSAIETFKSNNSYVSQRNLTIDPDIASNARHYLTIMLERFTKSLDPEAIQQPLELSYLYDNWRFGPGASNGVQGTHTAQKIVQNMTCTALCKPLVRKLRDRNPYFCLNDETQESNGISLVSGSRLTTVPKNEDTMRTIAIEPSGNMCLQLAAGSYLEGTLRYIGLDISKQQPKNKEAARLGSLTNSLATIDLKSASDLIGIDLVRMLMPPVWFELLSIIRSEEIELPGGTSLKLSMISTMGNGFTFPLMTLLIASLIYGFRCARGGPNLYIDWTNTCVFGDDIILPSSEFEPFCQVLTSAGLIVNYDKSYGDGPFRESCGGDYYIGLDVTPIYIKDLSSTPNIYVALNQLLTWCARHNVWLFKSILFLKGLLGGKVFLVPEWCNPNQGLLTALCSRKYSYLSITSPKQVYKSTCFDMMLCIGGYISESGPDLFFTPRCNNPRVKVRHARIPKGFLDASDPLTRTEAVTNRISQVCEILFK